MTMQSSINNRQLHYKKTPVYIANKGRHVVVNDDSVPVPVRRSNSILVYFSLTMGNERSFVY